MESRTKKKHAVNSVLKQVGKTFRTSAKGYSAVFECRCGNRVIARPDNKPISCGCIKKRVNTAYKINLTEEMISKGRLTQVGVSFQVAAKGGRKRHAVFQCSCGKRKVFDFWSVAKGSTASCGCLTVEALKQNKHNEGRVPKHGMTHTKAYKCWGAMIQRCTNPRNAHFGNYGGRGITVCSEWVQSFIEFFRHIGEPPSADMTIDRIDNDRGYCPGNVRWVTRKQNQRNRRVTAFVQYDGKQMSVAEFAETLNMKDSVVRRRLQAGWTIDRIVNTPIGRQRNA